MHAVLPLLALAGGCGAFDDVVDQVEGATNRFVVEAVLLGTVEPEDDRLADALAGTDAADGAVLSAWVVDAIQAGDLDEAPVSGVDMAFVSASGGSVALEEVEPGHYQLDADGGLVYTPGEEATLSTAYGGTNRRLSVRPPEAPSVAVPAMQEAGQPLTVDLQGQHFDTALVQVFRADTGELVFSNAPEGPEELYRALHGEGELVVEVPGGALSAEALYVVGVTGLVAGSPDDWVEVNTALSTFVAGRTTPALLCTLPDELLCEGGLDTGAGG